MELKQTILEGTINVYKKKGMKLTMDDIAKELSISKKTIYTVFADKESLFLTMVDYMFDSIKDSELSIIRDPELDTVDKIKKVLGAMPEKYQDIDFGQMYMLKEKFPTVYKKVQERLESGWENTILLINHGVSEGRIRPVSIPILKMMLEAALEQFFQQDVLVKNQIAYNDALNEVVNILVEGIAIH